MAIVSYMGCLLKGSTTLRGATRHPNTAYPNNQHVGRGSLMLRHYWPVWVPHIGKLVGALSLKAQRFIPLCSHIPKWMLIHSLVIGKIRLFLTLTAPQLVIRPQPLHGHKHEAR